MATDQEKYYAIYKDHVLKHGRKWAKETVTYDKRRNSPFGNVLKLVNGAMRRYLGSETYLKYSDTFEYLLICDGIAKKDLNNRLDITEEVFYQWVG